MKLYFFKNFKFVRSVEMNGSMLQTLTDLQRAEATNDKQTFTVLNPAEGYAFSQTYQLAGHDASGNRLVNWGRMFKHETGQLNPDPIPSYDQLITLIS